jgi:hypothetical protein
MHEQRVVDAIDRHWESECRTRRSVNASVIEAASILGSGSIRDLNDS